MEISKQKSFTLAYIFLSIALISLAFNHIAPNATVAIEFVNILREALFAIGSLLMITSVNRKS